MAIRLSIDIIGSTCGDLLRFADAVRAAGARPDHSLQHGPGPARIEVVVDDNGGAGPGPRMAPPQLQRPGTPFHHHQRPDSQMSGPFGACAIQINRDGMSHGTQVSIETVDRWRAALDVALGSTGLDDSTRSSLFHLRQIFTTDGGS
jgi:hypothetical protein